MPPFCEVVMNLIDDHLYRRYNQDANFLTTSRHENFHRARHGTALIKLFSLGIVTFASILPSEITVSFLLCYFRSLILMVILYLKAFGWDRSLTGFSTPGSKVVGF